MIPAMTAVRAAFLSALLLLPASAMAEEVLVPAGETGINLKAALGKQIDVRFSESFAKDRLARPISMA